MAGGRHPLARAVPAREAIGDDQGRQRQGDQGGHPVSDGEAERRLRADLGDGADEHAAAAGDGILHLAPLADDVEDFRADRRTIARVLVMELPVGRGVEVQRLDVDADLVGPELRPGVEDACRLGQ